MRLITQAIREGHQQQYPWIEKCAEIADQAGILPVEGLVGEIDRVIGWLKQDIIPDVDVEDRILYPTVAVIMGAPQATNTMRVDHAEFRKMSQELEYINTELQKGSTPELINRLRGLLYSLNTLLRLHFQKEEQVYLSIIDDHLTSEQGKKLLEAMDDEQCQRTSLQHVIVSQWVDA